MIEIFLASCIGCGVNGVYIRKVKRYAHKHYLNLTVYDSRYDDGYRKKHLKLLADNGFPIDVLTPIVFYNGKITRLREWSL